MSEMISVPLWVWIAMSALFALSAVIHVLAMLALHRQRKRNDAAMNIARDIFQMDHQTKTRLRAECETMIRIINATYPTAAEVHESLVIAAEAVQTEKGSDD